MLRQRGNSLDVRRDVYVVHDHDTGWRKEYSSWGVAFCMWKGRTKDGHEVAMYHWDKKGNCTRVYATQNYPFERDYPERRVTHTKEK